MISVVVLALLMVPVFFVVVQKAFASDSSTTSATESRRTRLWRSLLFWRRGETPRAAEPEQAPVPDSGH
jgi:hypothetical protein